MICYSSCVCFIIFKICTQTYRGNLKNKNCNEYKIYCVKTLDPNLAHVRLIQFKINDFLNCLSGFDLEILNELYSSASEALFKS